MTGPDTGRWPGHSPAPAIVTTLCILGAIGVTVWAVDPSLLLSMSTTTGGDTGAHVGLAAYLKSALLPHLHLTGWDPGAYDGYPLYTFYFPLPDAMAAVMGLVIPFAIAFKLMTMFGSFTLPVAAWAFGRLVGWERPIPAVLSVATLPFLFDQAYTIYGGNLYSTMAGEYAYSIGLSVAVVLLGLIVRGLRTGRHRALAAVLVTVCALSHLLALLFALAGIAAAVVFLGPTLRRMWWALSVAATGLLLVSFWAIPFAIDQPYSTNMGWINVTTYGQLLAPGGDRWALVAAAIGCVIALGLRDRVAAILVTLGVLAALAVVFDPQGKLYNTRFLPLWWLCVYLMAGYAFARLGMFVALWWRRGGPKLKPRAWAPGAVSVPVVAMVMSGLIVLPPLLISSGSSYQVLGIHITQDNVPGWAQWNYSGYQGKPAWDEFDHGVVDTMDRVGARYGCGRAMWEYNSNLNRFGTPEALMTLPYFTHDCIDSQEGLLFESASSTPWHFLDQSELSASPSDAMVGLDYTTPDVELGVEHLQLLGVRYFMATSPSIQAQADADPALTLVATSGPWRSLFDGTELSTTWKVYLVKDSPLVSPLTEQPSVLTGVGPQQSSWLAPAQRWYLDPAAWAHELVAGGPSSWPRQGKSASLDVAATALPTVRVTKIRSQASSLSFDVDRTGVPVLVKISYFPNWQASGALGPWRAEPNLMVVVPTSHHVEMHYGTTGADVLGEAMSLVGLVLVGVLLVRRPTFILR
ncbi:MAG: 6-pyruvoyl-tetrahydropterin synthase-related protein [Acidimicrobiales bacterium]